MQKQKNEPTSLEEAQIMGDIEVMPDFVEEDTEPEKDVVETVTDPGKFQYALSKAKLMKKDLEVSPEILKFILSGRKATSISYQGVRLFLQGTREETLRTELMHHEEYGKLVNEGKIKSTRPK